MIKISILLILSTISFNSLQAMNTETKEPATNRAQSIENDKVTMYIDDIKVTIPKHDSLLLDKLQMACSYGHIAFGLLASYMGMRLLQKSTQKKSVINFIISWVFLLGGINSIQDPFNRYANELIKHYKS